jgi:hypothetical protein
VLNRSNSHRYAWICAALLLGACKGKDVSLMPPGGSVDAASGETPLDASPGTDGMPSEVQDAGPRIPDALPFDALPVSEPEAPSAPLLAEIRDFEGRFALYARNLSTGGAVAHGAEEWLLAEPFMRLWAVAVYAEKVAAGALNPDDALVFTEAFYRGDSKDMTPEMFGREFKFSRLATLTLLSANASAEELLLSAIGGSAAVNAMIARFDLDGMGKYLGPCERERAYWQRLDPKFGEAECAALSVWANGEDARGIVPSLFPAPPVFTPEQIEAAWVGMMDAHENAATARGIGEVLARIHGHALPSAAGSPVLRDLLDHSLGSGGGGNNLPDAVWVSNLQGSVYNGRVWTALVRGGDAPVALVLMSDRESGRGAVGQRFDRAGMLAWEQLVGPIDLTPPAESAAHPDWLGGIFIHEPSESGNCNSMHADDYDALLACRRDGQRDRFDLHESTAATIMVREGPDVEATWLWTEPGGERHRYQVKIGPGGWWAWTRSFEAVAAGDWHLDVWLNGQPQLLGRFPVVE